MSFNQVQTFLLHRIFKDLDKSLFEADDPVISKTQTGSKTIPYEYRIRSPTATLKSQISVYNTIVGRIKKLPVTERNFEMLIYLFEYRYLYLRTNDLSRRNVIDLVKYVVNSCPHSLDVSTLIDTMKLLLDQSLSVVLDDFADFVRYFPNLTKYSLNNVIAITYAFEIFFYPDMYEKLFKVSTFIRHYYFTYLHRREGTFVDILEEVQRFCRDRYPYDEDLQASYIFDILTLSEFTTDGVVFRLLESEKEYRKRLNEF
ncbi:hypothetical protein Cantr_01807 [Candida viswanathii]|uniref:Uncharacterized protein n=1 Tax=Candida viswanathii TaxID=5486 RepID=A0A367YLX1_9ASCO|nr:hypothetical protein Cantr_01807 [Candida viswanathii]